MESSFFARESQQIDVDSPNGMPWWHSAPLPNGQRIKGAHPDRDRQFKEWEAMQIPELAGKNVLDIGANDGFFSVAAAAKGARVTAINTADWFTYPRNIDFLSTQWRLPLKVITGDFREHNFAGQRFDVIMFLGVIYHVENVFSAMQRLKSLLAPGGRIYLETHLSPIGGEVPVWEAASDRFPTSATMVKQNVGMVGISNFLLPNINAVVNLADTYELTCEPLLDNAYCHEDATRGIFVIS